MWVKANKATHNTLQHNDVFSNTYWHMVPVTHIKDHLLGLEMWVCSTPVHAGWQQELYGTLSWIRSSVLTMTHWTYKCTLQDSKNSCTEIPQEKEQTKSTATRQICRAGRGKSWKHLHRKRATQFHNMKDTEAASWHRERKAKRESVCREREINNFVSIIYLMLLLLLLMMMMMLMLLLLLLYFFVLFPQGGWKIYTFTDTCSRHWVEVWVSDFGYCTLRLTSWTTRFSCSLFPLPDCLN